MIVRELLAAVAEKLKGLRVEQAVIGLAYTGILLSDGGCGLAATPPEGGCAAFAEAGTLAGRSAWEFAQGLLSADPLLSALSLATVNAVLAAEFPAQNVDPLEALAVGKEDAVGMVGHIGPLVRPLRECARDLLIFERDPHRHSPGILPDWAAEWELPRCNVVFLSGTTFINKTVDHLLSLCQGRVAVIGPSTPLWPGLLSRGVDWLFGARVRDPELTLRVVAEGGGTQALFRHGVAKAALGCSRADERAEGTTSRISRADQGTDLEAPTKRRAFEDVRRPWSRGQWTGTHGP